MFGAECYPRIATDSRLQEWTVGGFGARFRRDNGSMSLLAKDLLLTECLFEGSFDKHRHANQCRPCPWPRSC